MPFAEDFRKDIEDAYSEVLSASGESLYLARSQGMSALVHWIGRRLVYDIHAALNTANPGDVERACARGALALLMLRDAQDAFCKMLRDAYDGPKELFEEKRRASMEAHGRGLRDVQVPDASFEQQLSELSKWGHYDIHAGSNPGYSLAFTPYFKRGEPQTFRGASLIAAVADAHAAIVEKKELVAASDPVGQS